MCDSDLFTSINGRTVLCPYLSCMHKTFVPRQKLSRNPTMVVCDLEDGGCGQWFAVTAQIVGINIEAFKVMK